MFVDSHAHLDYPAIRDQLPEILRTAHQAGVAKILSIACANATSESIDGVLELAQQHPQIYASVGVHPHDAALFEEALGERIVRAMEHPKVVAWGEIGLDFYYDNSPREAQRKAFVGQLELAARCGKPVIIHSRDAAQETCDLLEEHFSGATASECVMHCFTYDRQVAARSLALGHTISFGGIVTFPRSDELREVAAMVPDDRFLIETDSPYLAPAPHRGKSNQPAWVAVVADRLAEIRGQSREEIGALSSQNFSRIFGV